MRKKIEYIGDLIKEYAEVYKLSKGIITTDFTEDEQLFLEVKDDFYNYELLRVKKSVTTWGGETSEIEFDGFYNAALKEFMASNTIEASSSTTLRKNKRTWLDENTFREFDWDKGPTESYRERYFKYLSLCGRSDAEIIEVKKSTLSILEGFGNPADSKPFFTRGMVVGSVQSGKTANFNGVINSSIDMGYKLIIVLSGIMEDLRSQTQKRIETEVLGPLVGQDYIGVGRVCRMEPDPGNDWRGMKVQVNSITSRKTDFNQQIAAASAPIEKTNVLVVKKNVSVLKNILLWLKTYVNDDNPIIKVPLLIIDDEADNASLNNMGHKGRDYATRINQEIRAILRLFEKKTYVGYTATPFANILQYKYEEPSVPITIRSRGIEYKFELSEDLFPDDFIELLYPSSQYIGIKQFFETKDPTFRKIEPLICKPIPESDYLYSFPSRFWKNTDVITPTSSKEKGTRAAQKSDYFPELLPESLKEAVRCFVLSIAIRDARDNEMIDTQFYQPHNTMLIHISRFGDWQNRTKDLIISYLDDLSSQINFGYSSPVFELFKFTWDKHYAHVVGYLKEKYLDPFKYQDDYMLPIDFDKVIKRGLARAVDGIVVRAINSSREGENLLYPSVGDQEYEPKKYIAIGGNRLSRGFTLEGLTINYFLRATENADTLMQMGRWFGYRIGYLDCCKLFTVRENIEKYNEASLIIEDLEQKFEQLAKLPDKTPRDFTIWIRNNPDVIKLTRGNFLRNLKKMSLDFGSRIQQSSQFSIDKERIVNSFNAFKDLAQRLSWHKKNGFVIHETNQTGLKSFLDFAELEFNTMLNLNTTGLRGYLDDCQSKGKLLNWIIAIKDSNSTEGGILNSERLGIGHSIRQTVRRGPSKDSGAVDFLFNNSVFKVKNAQIISASDFSIGLKDDVKRQAIEEFRIEKEKEIFEKEFRNDPEGIEKAKKKAAKIMVPDFQYRKYMDESTGILIIYPLDLDKVFDDVTSSTDFQQELKSFGETQGLLGLNIPLIGFALGFPEVKDVKGGNFVTRHLVKEIEEMNVTELKKYIEDNNISIDLNEDWNRDALFNELKDFIENGASGDEEFDEALEI